MVLQPSLPLMPPQHTPLPTAPTPRRSPSRSPAHAWECLSSCPKLLLPLTPGSYPGSPPSSPQPQGTFTGSPSPALPANRLEQPKWPRGAPSPSVAHACSSIALLGTLSGHPLPHKVPCAHTDTPPPEAPHQLGANANPQIPVSPVPSRHFEHAGTCAERVGSLWPVPIPVPAGVPVAWPFCSKVSPTQLWREEAAKALGCRQLSGPSGCSSHREGPADPGEVVVSGA